MSPASITVEFCEVPGDLAARAAILDVFTKAIWILGRSDRCPSRRDHGDKGEGTQGTTAGPVRPRREYPFRATLNFFVRMLSRISASKIPEPSFIPHLFVRVRDLPAGAWFLPKPQDLDRGTDLVREPRGASTSSKLPIGKITHPPASHFVEPARPPRVLDFETSSACCHTQVQFTAIQQPAHRFFS